MSSKSAPSPPPAPPAPSTLGTDALAERAISSIRRGMTVGLGTGRAAARCIRALAARSQREKLDLTCVATSIASAELATSLGLRVVDLAEVARLDFLFDGADEVAPDLAMIKGGGGAMTREKLAAAMARAGASHDTRGDSAQPRCVYCIDNTKLVPYLGVKYPLPLEVLPGAVGFVMGMLEDYGMTATRRADKQDASRPYVTDNGNAVLDVKLDLPALEEDGFDLLDLVVLLDSTPGVVDHGIFMDEADLVLVETPKGVTEMTRPDPDAQDDE
jgi:ribose 5-phosphate isomerase A